MALSGYTTVFRGEEFKFPYKESIKSALGCCSEVIVLITLKNGEDTDGTLSNLKVMSQHDPRIKIYIQNWDKDNPLQDGNNKAKARGFCSDDMCLQFDADEIIHEKDYEYYTKIHELYPDKNIISVGCLDFYHTRNQILVDGVGNYKPRISKNLPWITHGLQAEFLEINQRTNKPTCPSMLSDGAGYINKDTGEDLISDVFIIDGRIEEFRKLSLNKHHIYLNDYAELIETTFNDLPYVFHYSCIDLPRKVGLQLRMWDNLWNLFAGNIDEFDEINDIDYKTIREKMMHRLNNSVSAYINVQHPKIAEEYLARIGK